jgi:hypothetical protein
VERWAQQTSAQHQAHQQQGCANDDSQAAAAQIDGEQVREKLELAVVRALHQGKSA